MAVSHFETHMNEIARDHAYMVWGLRKSGEEIRMDMTAAEADLWHMATGVATEAGELLTAVKANVVYRKALDRENVIEELGDLEFFIEGLRQVLEITRDETLTHNKAKLEKRYGTGSYSNEQAIARADKAA